MIELLALALVWGTEDDLRPIRAVHELLGPTPAGLGPITTRHFGDLDQLIEDAGPEAREVLDKLDLGAADRDGREGRASGDDRLRSDSGGAAARPRARRTEGRRHRRAAAADRAAPARWPGAAVDSAGTAAAGRQETCRRRSRTGPPPAPRWIWCGMVDRAAGAARHRSAAGTAYRRHRRPRAAQPRHQDRCGRAGRRAQYWRSRTPPGWSRRSRSATVSSGCRRAGTTTGWSWTPRTAGAAGQCLVHRAAGDRADRPARQRRRDRRCPRAAGQRART